MTSYIINLGKSLNGWTIKILGLGSWDPLEIHMQPEWTGTHSFNKKKGVPSAVGFPHCAGSGEGLSLRPKPYPHKCAEAGARTRDLPVTVTNDPF